MIRRAALGAVLAFVAAALVGPAPAAAESGEERAAQLLEQAMRTSSIATNFGKSPLEAKAAGDELQDALERAKAAPVTSYKWAEERDLRDSPSDAASLINAAEKRLRPDGIFVPGPTPEAGLAELKRMHGDGRVGMDGLPPTTHGIYTFAANDPVGKITLSERLGVMSQLLGEALAAAVAFHEVGHRLDEELHAHGAHDHGKGDMAQVVREEVFAFTVMQRYLGGIFESRKRGLETFATTIQRLEFEQKVAPHPARAAALAFAVQARRVFLAVDEFGRPDPEALKKLVLEWYKADGSPAVPSA